MKRHFETRLVHEGEARPGVAGAVVMPIFQSSTYEYGGEGSYHDVRYIRFNNTPNHVALGMKLASLEGAEAALVAGSGMSAISAVMLAFLKAGDHLIAQDCLYGGTYDLVTGDLAALGIEHTLVDACDPASFERALRPNTRLFYCESLTNPLMGVGDLPAVAAFARTHSLVSVIDSTFATPLFFRPIEHGFDLVVHSATKYLNGHSDIVAGAVMGTAAFVERVKHKLDHLGGSLDPHACFLLSRGLKTLALRVRHQDAGALALARFLAEQPAVARVNHPGLTSHPDHARARALFTGTGGMLSFELHGGAEAAERLFKRLTIPIVAPSLGGPETLVTRPATTSHAGLTPDQRKAAGISDGLVRVSVGLEASEDLIDDIRNALG